MFPLRKKFSLGGLDNQNSTIHVASCEKYSSLFISQDTGLYRVDLPTLLDSSVGNPDDFSDFSSLPIAKSASFSKQIMVIDVSPCGNYIVIKFEDELIVQSIIDDKIILKLDDVHSRVCWCWKFSDVGGFVYSSPRGSSFSYSFDSRRQDLDLSFIENFICVAACTDEIGVFVDRYDESDKIWIVDIKSDNVFCPNLIPDCSKYFLDMFVSF